MTFPSYLVLGSTGEIGRVLCERLARRGASLVLGGRDMEKLDRLAARTGGEVCPGDARESATVERALALAIERHGRLDGAVDLVGSVLTEPAHPPSFEEWSDLVTANVGAAFHFVGCAAKALRREGGSIVLLSPSAAGDGSVGPEAIATAKVGFEKLTQNAAASYAAENVRVNCVAPGLMHRPLTEPFTSAPSHRAAPEVPHPPVSRCDPEDVASAIAWLLDPVNDWVTGQVVGLDGDLAAIRGSAYPWAYA
jgi:NAD(P)-dependent dehydrogenase (short-subunit alcohol dehydrogenase family)